MDMDRRVLAFVSVLFLVTTSVRGLRSCVEVQNTLMACILSSDMSLIIEQGPHVDVDRLCWEVSVLLECVADARSTCPNLPVLSNPDFAHGIHMMENSWDTYCKVTEPPPTTPPPTISIPMQGDQAESCDPLQAMMDCNEIMADVTPGDIQAMCGPGEKYLACMTQIVHNCPAHAEVLPFDLPRAIDATRGILEQQCPAEEEEVDCAVQIEDAKRGCADFLTDGNGDYCGSLKTYRECLDVTLIDCPDEDLQRLLFSQYQHHCIQALPQSSQHGAGSECPDDVEAALQKCTSYTYGLQSSDKATFCRKSRKYLKCMKTLIQQCENDSRFAMLPSVPLKQLRQQINSVCDPQGGRAVREVRKVRQVRKVREVREASHPSNSPKCPDDLQGAVMECTSHLYEVQSDDIEAQCRASREFLRCFEDLLQRCENDSRIAQLPSDSLEHLRQQINSTCTSKGGQPLPEAGQDNSSSSECPEDLQGAVQECTSHLNDLQMDDIEAYCRASGEVLRCFEDLFQRCQNDSRSAQMSPEALDYLRQQMDSNCASQGGQPLPEAGQDNSSSSECPEDLQGAVQECASHLYSLQSKDMEAQCRAVGEALGCMDNILKHCGDDPQLAMIPSEPMDQLRQQYSSMCEGEGGQALPEAGQHNSSSECPEELEAAAQECISPMHDLPGNDLDAMCRTSREVLECVENLLQQCEDDPRLAQLPPKPIEAFRQQIDSMCDSQGNAIQLQRRDGTRNPVRSLRTPLLHWP